MKKFLSSAAAAFLIVAGSVTIGATAANATETYPVCTPSDAWTEVTPDIEHPAETHTVDHPAEYQDVLVTPAVEYQPAVYEVEYEFQHVKTGKIKWNTNPNWNAENNSNSTGWVATGNTRDGALISAEVPAQDAVYDHQLVKDAWTETITDKEAWTEDVPDIEHPAVTCPPEVVIPEQPETTTTVDTQEQKDCEAGMVIVTTTTTTSGRTEYNEYTNTWEPIEDLVTTDHTKREATETECPTVVTPPEENKPPVVTPPVTPVTPEQPQPATQVSLTSAEVVPTGNEQLAQTGSDFNWSGPIAGGALFLAGVSLLVIRRFRAAHN